MTPPSTAEDDPWLELRDLLYGLARRDLPAALADRADDLVQELLAWALTHYPKRSPESLRPLLATHMPYRVIDEIKRVREERGTLVPIPDPLPPDPRDEQRDHEEQQRQADKEWLARHYAPRPRRERAVIELTELDEMTGQQAAEVLGESVANVYQIRHRVFEQLRRHQPPIIDQGDPR